MSDKPPPPMGSEEFKRLYVMMLDSNRTYNKDIASHILAIKTILVKHGLVTEEDYEKLRIRAIQEVDQQYEHHARNKLAALREEYPDQSEFFDWLQNENVL